jgi:hypothetical protein
MHILDSCCATDCELADNVNVHLIKLQTFNAADGIQYQQQVFPTRLLTSDDEYKWYWHQMIYFSETINTISTMNIYITDTFTLSS